MLENEWFLWYSELLKSADIFVIVGLNKIAEMAMVNRPVNRYGSPGHFRVFVRYAFFQIPGILMALLGAGLAVKWMELPLWMAAAFVCAWVVKDMVMFRFVWRSYDCRIRPGDPFSMIGLRGIAQERLAPSGYVLVRGERWRGDVTGHDGFVEKGEMIQVREVKGLTLLVEPVTVERLEKEG